MLGRVGSGSFSITLLLAMFLVAMTENESILCPQTKLILVISITNSTVILGGNILILSHRRTCNPIESMYGIHLPAFD